MLFHLQRQFSEDYMHTEIYMKPLVDIFPSFVLVVYVCFPLFNNLAGISSCKAHIQHSHIKDICTLHAAIARPR